MDRISLANMSFFARHGLSEAERRVGHRFEIDIDMFVGLLETKDDISRTVDYNRVYDQVETVVQGNSYHLIETLAQELASTVLISNKLVEKVTVRVRKIHPPIDGNMAAAEVEISRAR